LKTRETNKKAMGKGENLAFRKASGQAKDKNHIPNSAEKKHRWLEEESKKVPWIRRGKKGPRKKQGRKRAGYRSILRKLKKNRLKDEGAHGGCRKRKKNIIRLQI